MNQSLRLLLTSTALVLGGIIPATAQQITGTPGSPSATTTIDGHYIPWWS
jgi:arylsulfatase